MLVPERGEPTTNTGRLSLEGDRVADMVGWLGIRYRSTPQTC